MSARSSHQEPWMVGLLRGSVGGVILALIAVLVVQVGNLDAGTLAPYLPVAVLALRTAEAWILDQRKPPPKRTRKRRAKPPAVTKP